MVIGAAARIYQVRIASWLPSATLASATLSGLMVSCVLVITFFPEVKGSPATYLAVCPAVAVMTVVLLFHLRTWETAPFAWLRPVLALGTISYAAYLWNYPIVTWMGARPFDAVRAIGSILVTLAAAAASWWLVEKPFHTWKSRLNARAEAEAEATRE